jgi:hypothetical protein
VSNTPRIAPRTPRATTRRPPRATRLAPLALAAVLTACGTPQAPSGGPPPPPPPDDARLFLAVGAGADAGLYAVEPGSGAAVRVGPWIAAEFPSSGVGLAPDGASEPLFAAYQYALHRAATDGAAPTLLRDSIGSFTEALAHDPQLGYLYVGINGFLFLHRASDGARLATLLSPPNEPDVEGLAFDPDERLLYGVARGYPDSHPAAHRALYALDVDAVEPAWTEVGDTGGHWANSGLAFDPEARVLYATGRQGDPGALYRIDPDTGATTRVGATGLATAEGGLAWR